MVANNLITSLGLPGHLSMPTHRSISIPQGSVIDASPSHALPPLLASFFVRMFVRVPIPQDLEHAPTCHSFHSQFFTYSGVTK